MRFLIFLLMLGCSSEYVFWKSDFKSVAKIDKKYYISVEVPEYLMSGNFVKVKDNKLILTDKKINSTPNEFFAKYIALSLQKLLNDENILYFSIDEAEEIDVKIINFYYDEDKKEAILQVFYKKMLEFRGKNYKEAFDEFIKYLAKDLYDKK